jgi:copper(I)-binding protein
MTIRDAVVAAVLVLMSAGAGAAEKTITVSEAWSRATAKTARAAGAFMTIANSGTEADRLTEVRSQAAKTVEVHETTMVANVMKMRRIEGGLPVPPGGKAELKPGGLHVMLIDLAGQLVQGERFDMTLVFERAGEIPVTVEVRSPGAMAVSAHGGGHMK